MKRQVLIPVVLVLVGFAGMVYVARFYSPPVRLPEDLLVSEYEDAARLVRALEKVESEPTPAHMEMLLHSYLDTHGLLTARPSVRQIVGSVGKPAVDAVQQDLLKLARRRVQTASAVGWGWHHDDHALAARLYVLPGDSAIVRAMKRIGAIDGSRMRIEEASMQPGEREAAVRLIIATLEKETG
jgi:hypothetical protein